MAALRATARSMPWVHARGRRDCTSGTA